jgi:signal transduction histidine kinase
MTVSARLNLVALAVAAVAVALIGGVALYAIRTLIDRTEHDLLERAKVQLAQSIDARAAANQAIAATLARLPSVGSRFDADERAGLIADLGPVFEGLTSYGVNYVHFHRAAITSLARLHAPDHFDDHLANVRPMIVAVQASQLPHRGIELGPTGLAIRGAVPAVAADGRRRGVVEVGSFIDQAFLASLDRPGTAYQIHFRTGGALAAVARSDHSGPPALAADMLRAALDGDRVLARGTAQGRRFISSALPLRNFVGGAIGVVQIDIDVDELEGAFARAIEFLLIGTLVVGLIAVAVMIASSRAMLRGLEQLIGVTAQIAADERPVTVPMRDRGDEFGRFARAVEKFRTSRSELREARDQALAASVAKSNFLAVVSHELRTPLNAIIGFTELILLWRARGRADAGQEMEYLKDVLDSASHLKSLINDVLTSSSIELGKLKVELEPMELEPVLAKLVRQLHPKLRESDLHLGFDVAQGLPPVLGDPRAIAQIGLNLLSNAVKFTPRGGIVSLSARIAGDMAEISVADSGPGIEPAHLGQVTLPFFQVEPALARRNGGVGLGLSIAERLARLHDGTLTLANRPEGGLIVTLRFPARIAEAAACRIGDVA